jgi:hypothetical protein
VAEWGTVPTARVGPEIARAAVLPVAVNVPDWTTDALATDADKATATATTHPTLRVPHPTLEILDADNDSRPSNSTGHTDIP